MRGFRRIKAISCAILLAAPVSAQDVSEVATLDVDASVIEDRRANTQLTLALSQVVPYRVFTLDDPRRLVLDFREVDFSGLNTRDFDRSDRVSDVRFGALRAGWSRMVLDLEAPMAVLSAGMGVDAADGTARINVVLDTTSPDDFAAKAGALDDPDWAFLMLADPPAQPPVENDGVVVLVIDPGHGGLDPGAQAGDVQEADVMLALALELEESLANIDGVQPVLTRSQDIFVPLQERLTVARGVGADLFISLHADALEGPQATGASVYTLTDRATEAASLRMAERHERGDLLAGIDLGGQPDEIAIVLQDLVRVETAAAGERFAQILVAALQNSGAVLNSRPRREAELAVLNAADFASILLEVGFLSNAQDRARLTSPQGRAPIVEAVTLAVARWVVQEQTLAPLIRQ